MHALGLRRAPTRRSCWAGTTAIVAAVDELTDGPAARRPRAGVVRGAARRARAGARPRAGRLAASPPWRRTRAGSSARQVVSNAAVLHVRRHRDDRGDDRQRASCTCSRTRTQLRARARRPARCSPGAVEESLRLEPAAAVRRPLRDARRRARRRARSRARRPRPRLGHRAPTAIPPSSRTPTASTSRRPNARPPPRLRRAGRTSASGCTSRGSRRTPRSAGCSTRLPGLRLDAGAPGRAARARVPQAAGAERGLGLERQRRLGRSEAKRRDATSVASTAYGATR